MKQIVIFISIFYFTSSGRVWCQTDEEKVEMSFDSVIYARDVINFGDPVIFKSFQLKNNLPHGWAVEFNQNGSPKFIGKYKKGFKEGYWYSSGGLKIEFEHGVGGLIAIPYCGNAKRKQSEVFFEAYDALLLGKNPRF